MYLKIKNHYFEMSVSPGFLRALILIKIALEFIG